MKKENELTEWLHDVLFNAKLYDYRYPVKGMGIWMPYGYRLRWNVLNIMRDLLDKKGHHEVQFPILIPKDMLEKEAAHIKGFATEVFWVTKGGASPLEIELALRPTSETPMTTAFKYWVQSWKDLPIKVYQIGSVFRYETKATKPLIRVREVSTFKEAFTAHASKEDAMRQFREAINIYKAFFNRLCIPYYVVDRPEWDRFAGAARSVAFDTIMPDGRRLQIGSVHYLGQRFSKAFDAKFMKEDGTYEYLYQLSYGISERVIAALLAIHGDDKGPVLPPNVAPIQIVIVPIPYKGLEEKINTEARKIGVLLKRRRFRVVIDDRPEITPGSKFYEWERMGVPIRVEIGPKDIENKVVTVARRDTGIKTIIEQAKLGEELRILMKNMIKEMKQKAWKELNERLIMTRSINEISDTIAKGKVAMVPWCKKSECGHKLEEITDFKILGTPLKKINIKHEKCTICREEARTLIYVARSY
ncbi:MAG: proline--tRNA ligase [Thermoprotei archaeon]